MSSAAPALPDRPTATAGPVRGQILDTGVPNDDDDDDDAAFVDAEAPPDDWEAPQATPAVGLASPTRPPQRAAPRSSAPDVEAAQVQRAEGTGAALANIGRVQEMISEMARYKDDLPPPPPPRITAAEYFDPTTPDQSCHVDGMGRPLQVRRTSIGVKCKVRGGVVAHARARARRRWGGPIRGAPFGLTRRRPGPSAARVLWGRQLWMADEFPIGREAIRDVLRPLRAASPIVEKIIDVLELDLPPGFPIRMGNARRAHPVCVWGGRPNPCDAPTLSSLRAWVRAQKSRWCRA